MGRKVREPIQVYLTDEERTELDRLARESGVSRSELLRRGVQALGSAASGPLRDLIAGGLVTPAAVTGTTPPGGPGVAPLDVLLEELETDRADR